MRFVIGVCILTLLTACDKERIVIKPQIELLIPHKVDCPDEPAITTDPSSDAFVESMMQDYIKMLREAHMICHASVELQNIEIEQMKKRYENLNSN
jgi:hypothetical protein